MECAAVMQYQFRGSDSNREAPQKQSNAISVAQPDLPETNFPFNALWTRAMRNKWFATGHMTNKKAYITAQPICLLIWMNVPWFSGVSVFAVISSCQILLDKTAVCSKIWCIHLHLQIVQQLRNIFVKELQHTIYSTYLLYWPVPNVPMTGKNDKRNECFPITDCISYKAMSTAYTWLMEILDMSIFRLWY